MKNSQALIPHFKREVGRQQELIKGPHIPDITYDSDYNLLSFHGFQVGSKVRLNPELMELFIQNRSNFSDSFLQKYSSGIFEVSYFQGRILFQVEHEKLGLVMESDRHRTEFMQFLSKNAVYKARSHSELHQYVSTDYRNLTPHLLFENVLIPTLL